MYCTGGNMLEGRCKTSSIAKDDAESPVAWENSKKGCCGIITGGDLEIKPILKVRYCSHIKERYNFEEAFRMECNWYARNPLHSGSLDNIACKTARSEDSMARLCESLQRWERHGTIVLISIFDPLGQQSVMF